MLNPYSKKKDPDILEVIADLSSDEIRTPPSVARDALDLLPDEVWHNPNLRWIDPFSKTGVFPREITKRLLVTLADQIPDQEERLDHILRRMVFGVAITEITSLVSRRTLYCSRRANGSSSVVRFESEQGNLLFEKGDHIFLNGRCSECRAAEKDVSLITSGENYAYMFLHQPGRERIREKFGMKFDIVVGNPPYQTDVKGSSDIPIYDLFVNQAKALSPRFISMIIPAKWYAGGKNLGKFREEMLKDRSLSKLVDFPRAQDVFPSVSADFEGGVCYFLWDADHSGNCTVSTFLDGSLQAEVSRDLRQHDVFVRDARALSILSKAEKLKVSSVADLTTGQTPFGIHTNARPAKPTGQRALRLLVSDKGKRSYLPIPESVVTKGSELIDSWKVFVPAAYGERGATPAYVLGPTEIGEPGTVCTQTYLAFGPFQSEIEAKNFEGYLSTKVARYLISLRKLTQHAGKGTYEFLPQVDFGQAWTDESLSVLMSLTPDEMALIDESIRSR